jgi:trehalose 6-phosphate phosphatase
MSEPSPVDGPVLGADLREALARFAGLPRVLVALDFDGVLSPLVPVPEEARPTPAGAAALARLARADGVQVALVSGRRLADLVAVASPPPGSWLSGSHGAEQGEVGPDGEVEALPVELTDDQRALLDDLRERVHALAAEVEGAWVEDKPTAVVVHTRRAVDEVAAADLERAVLDQMRARPGVRTVPGKRVVELAVSDATKGDSVRALRERLGGVAVLFAGDDVTDEDALRQTTGTDDVGVKVGDGETVAPYRVTGPDAVAALLDTLADLRV